MPLIQHTKLLFFLFLFFTPSLVARYINTSQQNSFLIMLSPAGDAKQIGRTIGDSFERGIALQYAEQLKKIVEKQYPHVTIIVNRFPSDIVYPLQNASFANRLQVDFFISIHFYQTTEIKPHLHLYQFTYNDDFITPQATLSFYSYDQAHLFRKHLTDTYINYIQQSCKKDEHQKLFITNDIIKIPFKPLIGVVAPAIGIEMGIKNSFDWQQYIEPITQSIGTIIESN